MDVFKFIINNWDNIAAIVIFVLSLVYAVIQKDKKTINEILFKLISSAEVAFGSGTGDLKRADVLEKLYSQLPVSIKTFVPKKVLVKWIEAALVNAKETWKKNPAILKALSIIEGVVLLDADCIEVIEAPEETPIED